MSSARRAKDPSRQARRAGRLVAALLMVIGPLAATSIAAPLARADSDDTALPVSVSIRNIDPVAPQPHTQVSVTAVITNRGATPLTHYDTELRLGYTPLQSRGDIAADAREQTHFSSDVPAGGRWDATLPLQPGQSVTVTLSFLPDQVRHQQPRPMLTAYGVYRLGVEVHATDQGNLVVGLQNSFLPWLPAGGYDRAGGWSRLKLTWLWPLADRPLLGPTGTLRGGDLTGELSAGGRLDQLLKLAVAAGEQHGTHRLPTPPTPAQPAPPAATPAPSQSAGQSSSQRTRARTGEPPSGGNQPTRRHHKPAPPPPTVDLRPVPVTYTLDPALVEALGVLASGKSAGHQAAATYLADLRAELTTGNLVALPYGDPDIAALSRAGADQLLRDAGNARDAVLAKADLPKAVLDVAVPPSGFLPPDALDRLTAPYVVLDSGAMPLLAPLNYTPTALTQIPRSGGPVTALLADPGLQRLATTKVTAGSAAIVRQQFAAETAMIVAELPHQQREAVLSLPPQFDPQGTAVGALLADSGQLPWLDPVTVDTAVDGSTDPAAIHTGPRYPASARAAELPRDYVGSIVEAATRVADLRHMLCPPPGSDRRDACQPDELALPLEHALLACASATWRDDPIRAAQLRDTTADQTRDYLGKVHITTAGTVTLVSASGSIPITIANDLPLPVTVRLAITTPNQSQLRIASHRLYVVPSGAKSQQTIEAHTSSAGKAKFPIYVQLETPAGDPVGARTELVVRSSAYGIVAVAITGGALVVLFGTVAIRLTRTALSARTREGRPTGD